MGRGLKRVLAGQKPYDQLQMSTVAQGELDPLNGWTNVPEAAVNACVLLPDGRFLQGFFFCLNDRRERDNKT